ncbi:hypothetical protein H5410_015020, partial [Solanum commersonii]
MAAPHREPQIEVPPLGVDLADTVGKAQDDDPIILNHSNTVPPLLPRLLVWLLVHPGPHYTLDAKVDSRVRGQNGRHNGSEVPGTWTIDLSSLEAKLASLRTDVDAILVAPTIEPQAAPTALADDIMLDDLFCGTAKEGLEPTHAK